VTESFSLALTAVDVVVEQLKLPRNWLPFTVPHVGVTLEERKQHVERVWADLRTAGLAGRTRLDGDVDAALKVWTKPDVLIAVRLEQNTGRRIVLYRAGWSRGGGILSEQADDRIHFDLTRPDQVVNLLVGELPAWSPVPLREVSIVQGGAAIERDYDPLAFPDEDSDMRTVRKYASWPVERFGSFELSVRTPGGQLKVVDIIQFVDTEGGRYVVFTTPLGDGSQRLSFVPSDGSHLRHRLHEQIARAQDDFR
jgi:hypothetical protein